MENTKNQIFNVCLKKLTIKKRMTMQEIADALDVSYGHLNRVSNGHKKPSKILIDKISDLAALTTTERIKALSDTPIEFSRAEEGAALYEKPKIIEYLEQELEKKNKQIDNFFDQQRKTSGQLDKILDDQRQKTEQADKLIAEIQKLTNLTIELSKKL